MNKKKSDDDLIKEIQELSQTLNRTPRSKDYKNLSLVVNRYGSWNNFLKAANLDTREPKVKTTVTKEQLREELKQLETKLGRIPKAVEFRHYKWARRYYGSWEAFLKTMGLEKYRNPELPVVENHTDEQLIKEVQDVAKELGRPPKTSEFKYYRFVRKQYGSWNSFLKDAGLDFTKKNQNQVWTEEKLISDIQQLSQQLNRMPMSSEYNKKSVVYKRFGNWQKFIEAAGLEYTKRSYDGTVSNDLLIKEVKELAKELGRAPKTTEYPRYSMIYKRFGSWNDFLESINLELVPREYPIKYTNEELIEEIIELNKKLKKIPLSVDYQKSSLACRRYGSWKKFIEAAGLDSSQLREKKYYSDEELIKEVQKLAESLGRTPTSSEYVRASLASKRYGGWHKFLETAGLPLIRSKKEAIYTNDMLVKEVQELAEQLGRTPLTREYTRSTLAYRRFNSWNSFLNIAGLPLLDSDGNQKKYTNEELVHEIQQVARKLGREPLTKDYMRASLAIKRYGNWKTFLKEAGITNKKRSADD